MQPTFQEERWLPNYFQAYCEQILVNIQNADTNIIFFPDSWINDFCISTRPEIVICPLTSWLYLTISTYCRRNFMGIISNSLTISMSFFESSMNRISSNIQWKKFSPVSPTTYVYRGYLNIALLKKSSSFSTSVLSHPVFCLFVRSRAATESYFHRSLQKSTPIFHISSYVNANGVSIISGLCSI